MPIGPIRRALRATATACATVTACAFGAAAASWTTPVAAQPAGPQPAQSAPGHPGARGGPTLRLEAQAQREVTDDTVTATLFVERDGPQPAPLQSGVNAVLQTALADLKSDPQLQVRSGGYSTRPRYARDGRNDGWKVRADVVVESADAAAVSRAVTQVAGRLNVAGIGFRLSTERRAQTENDLTAEAAARFKEKARLAAKALGYADFELVDVGLNTGMPPSPPIQARAMAMAVQSEAAVPVPIEPGRSQVSVTFSGTVRLINRRPE
ncbi:MAG: DUF541 domain-containing protein [Burkholderiaceae bacterium]|nr:MAG: DUF541 domain-containing protein [Burkholderiaceae bacterium]